MQLGVSPAVVAARRAAKATAKAAGALTYMGAPCKRGHSGERYISVNGCVECKKTIYQVKHTFATLSPEAKDRRRVAKLVENLSEERYQRKREVQWKHSKIYSAKNPWVFLKWPEFVEKIYEQQGVCWGCGTLLNARVAKGKTGCVPDHCHTTLIFRHVLCNVCNGIEGLVSSNIGKMFAQDSAAFVQEHAWVRT